MPIGARLASNHVFVYQLHPSPSPVARFYSNYATYWPARIYQFFRPFSAGACGNFQAPAHLPNFRSYTKQARTTDLRSILYQNSTDLQSTPVIFFSK